MPERPRWQLPLLRIATWSRQGGGAWCVGGWSQQSNEGRLYVVVRHSISLYCLFASTFEGIAVTQSVVAAIAICVYSAADQTIGAGWCHNTLKCVHRSLDTSTCGVIRFNVGDGIYDKCYYYYYYYCIVQYISAVVIIMQERCQI